MLQTLCFKLFVRHPKKPQDEPRNIKEGPRMVQGGPRTKQQTSRRIEGGPKECSGRAMCSNNAPGCSQEYFSLRSGGTSRNPRRIQGGPKECFGRAMCSKNQGCSQEYFSPTSEKLQGGSKEGPSADEKRTC